VSPVVQSFRPTLTVSRLDMPPKASLTRRTSARSWKPPKSSLTAKVKTVTKPPRSSVTRRSSTKTQHAEASLTQNTPKH